VQLHYFNVELNNQKDQRRAKKLERFNNDALHDTIKAEIKMPSVGMQFIRERIK
jgi:hypothetical protein